MTPEQRLEEIFTLQNSLSHSWNPIALVLLDRKAELVKKLIDKEEPETRGRIKEIDFLLSLPERLQQEAVGIKEVI